MFTSQEEITSALCIEGTQCEAGKDDRGAQESSQDDAIKMNTIICHVLKKYHDMQFHRATEYSQRFIAIST